MSWIHGKLEQWLLPTTQFTNDLVICDYKGQKIPELKENVDICIAPLLIYPITINETWFSCYSIAAPLKHESLATCYQCCVCLSLLLYFNWCTQVLHPWQQGIWSPSSFPAVHPRTPQLKLSYMVISSFLETENKAGFIIIIFYFKISYLLIWTGWDKNQFIFFFFNSNWFDSCIFTCQVPKLTGYIEFSKINIRNCLSEPCRLISVLPHGNTFSAQ